MPNVKGTTAFSDQLRTRFEILRQHGLRDFKFWFVGPSCQQEASVEDLCEEAIDILDAHQRGSALTGDQLQTHFK